MKDRASDYGSEGLILMALESGTVILEMKDGAYEPIGPEDILSM